MYSEGLRLIKSEWKLSLFFISIILLLGCIPIFIYDSVLLNIFLFILGLDLYNGYFLTLGKILRGEEVQNPYKSIFFEKDKNRSDFLILIVFFAALLMIFKGPMILFNVLLGEKLNQFLSSSGALLFAYSLTIVFANSIYKIAIYTAIASLKYFRHEVIDSFKDGMKGIWKFKLFLLVLFLYEIAAAFTIETQNPTLINCIKLFYFILPAILMIFISSEYNLKNKLESEAGISTEGLN